jgi:hypothetical protein
MPAGVKEVTAAMLAAVTLRPDSDASLDCAVFAKVPVTERLVSLACTTTAARERMIMARTMTMMMMYPPSCSLWPAILLARYEAATLVVSDGWRRAEALV